ncbi:MAG: signal transduction histidine kinase [Kiritimatiellia bacterium]|jgi:signal transduction histidine kinase
MRQTLLLATTGRHVAQIRQACEALSVDVEVRKATQTADCAQRVWVLDLPLDKSIELAQSRPPGTVALAIIEEGDRDAAFERLADLFDDVAVIPFSQIELNGRIAAAVRRVPQSASDRSHCTRLLAHDINNPLTAIRLLADMLVGDVQDPQMRRDMEDILEASDLAAAFVESVSTLAKIDLPPARSPLVSVDCCSMLHQAGTRPCMRGHIRLELPPNPVLVRAEEAALKSAVSDMILNARTLTEGRDVFWASVRVEGNQAIVRATSPSKKIPADMTDGLHRPYGVVPLRNARIHVAPTGLAHASSTATRFGGTLRIFSDERGTTFELRLPVHTHR